MTKISIVIITLNEEEHLPNLLESIREQEYEDYEIIVSDAKSSDRTADIAEEYGAKVVEGERKGPGYGRNRGAEEAGGDIILFLDADIKLADSSVLKKVEKSLEGTENVCGTSTYITEGETIRSKIFFGLGSVYMRIFNRLGLSTMTSGDFLTVKREVFEDVGGFKEDLPFYEDIDLTERVLQYGNLVTLKNEYYKSGRRVDEKGILGCMKDYYPPQIYRMLGMEEKMKEKYSFETAGSSE